MQSNSVTLTNSTVSGNSTSNSYAHGGGVIATGAAVNVTLVNSTVSNNSTTGFNAQAGGIFSGGQVSLTNSTVAFNTSTVGADGVHAFQSEVGNPTELTMVNSIIAQAGAGELACNGPAVNGDNNIVANPAGDGAGCGTAILLGGTGTTITALNLGALAFNGGPTQTHALGTGSAAIDTGLNAVCDFAPVSSLDQRGVARPVASDCDVGAFELAGLDLGDAPDADPQVIPTQSYPTLLANNGAAHAIDATGPHLGATAPDAEADGQPNASASGDGADEDGLTPTTFPIGATTPVTITVSNAAGGFGNAWIDFNGDGDWDDAGEQVATEVDTTPGSFTFNVVVAANAPPATFFARARVCGTALSCNTPRGLASNGEVEDYAVTVGGSSGGGGIVDDDDHDNDGVRLFYPHKHRVGALGPFSLILIGLFGLRRRLRQRG